VDGLYIALIVVNFALIALPPALERRRRRAARRGLMAIGAVKQGEKVRIMGSAVARGALRTSPILQRRCIGYRVVVECDEYGGFPRVHTVIEQEEFDSFALVDATAKAVLHAPFEMKLDPYDARDANLPPVLFEILEREGVAIRSAFGINYDFRYVETILMPGEEITAVGRATIEIDPAGRAVSHREPPALCHMKGVDEAVIIADAEELTV